MPNHHSRFISAGNYVRRLFTIRGSATLFVVVLALAVVAAVLLASTAFVPTAAADKAYHSEHIDLVPVDSELGKAGGAPPGTEGRNLDHFCLRIDPFDESAIRRHLDMNGVDAGETAIRYGAEGEGHSIYVSDPEGNVVELKGPPVSKISQA